MLEKTAQWIKDFGYDEKTQCSICQKDPNQHMGQFIGWDKEHRPVMFMSMRWGPERKNPLEHMVCCFKHLISQMPQGVEKWVCVTDFESYSHFKDGKPSMGLGVINTIQDHFPERLGKMICVNPPTLFWVLWKAFYNFIDPVTRTKVEFVYTEDKPCIYESFPKLFPYHIRGFMYDTYNRSKHKLPAEPLVWVPDPDGYPTTHDERKEQLKANKAREKDDKKAVKEAEKEKKDAAKEASDHHKKKESKGKSSKGKDKEKKDGEEAASAPEEAASAHTQTASNKESQKE
ncbi:hypothetical protein AGDE_09752 [Angomonas deanei]|nr:hypothetical protein AGDE_09752 [Angomonas deanei]|eukprot:EPY29859.1 hypothetical protein AGDE_09752 [Angomonas deanei]